MSQLPASELSRLARRGELFFRTGPFIINLHTRYKPVIELLSGLYAESECFRTNSFANFHVHLERPSDVRRWFRPQIQFSIDSRKPFEPFPLEQALPLFEWGLNWCIAMEAHRFLMLHSAIVEKNGRALILPALPGSGKSTLCTALAHRGWRLLSDEFGLLEPASSLAWPLPRAIPLKNQSIPVIREYLPDAWIGPEFHKTRKGTVAHVKPPADSLLRQTEPAKPAWVVFPKYQAGSKTHLTPVAKSEAFTRLANNSFNYIITGEAGFRTLCRVIDAAECFNFRYSDLDDAIATFDDLATQ